MNKHTETPSQALPQLKPLVASILALGAMPALALAQMPTGGKVVAGAATITNPDGSHTVVEQSSDKAVLNWQSFSIGQGGSVQFVQRDSSSVALNRVVGSDPSSILGNLSANGQIFLVNQNGIFFGHSAKVDVAGIVATTLDIKDEDFMRGDYRFARGADAPARATVINEGALNANGGYVVLAGDYAANKGVVQAQLGTVLLASGDALTLQMAGSSLINYQIDKATVAHLAGVANSGQILANGGRVIMTADVAQDLASTVVNNSGLIQAQSAVEKNGVIYFEGNGGNVANSGTLDASAQAGAHGGRVEIRASGDIAHEAGSKIDVSGADSGVSDAGSVMTWADGTNRYKEGAQIAARGGKEGGNGGDVELSGNHVVNRSIVDLRAPKGELGTLTLDPLAITIADGAGTNSEDGATIYEQNLEAQLKVGNVSLLATGQDASITVADLSDGALDGSNNGSGGSLSLRAEGSGNPIIRFLDRSDVLLVDKAIDISTGAIEADASGSIDVGHLNAGTRIDLASGSIRAASLTVYKTIDTQSDNAFAIAARATNGNLTVDYDASVDVRNLQAGALSTSVILRADRGDVLVGGAVESKATGLGYYNYNWTTPGNNATSYYGAQPWTLGSQADHPILATLNIQAAGNVHTGDVTVLATDKNVAFDSTPGGYWQTAEATRHNFWRPTGAKASASVSAGADIAIDGKTSVKADGYATSSYSETESWRAMVDNFNYTSGSQTVVTTRSNGSGGTTETRTVNNYNNVKGSIKGAGSQRYIWSFGPYSIINGSVVNNSSNVSSATDSASGSDATAMGYGNVAGMSATLNVNAAGSVAMGGLDVRSTNRSGTGGGSFTDAFWGRQDTAAGLNGTGSSFTSAQREIDYKDVFQTSYSAATSTATANITAGDNASVSIGTHSDVVAEHTQIDAATNSLAAATMNVTAGSAAGLTGNGLISIAGGINVQGASGSDVSLNIRSYDGDIVLGGAGSSVTNTYVGADARAQVIASNGKVDAQGIAVTAGHAAYLDVSASGSLALAGAASADVTYGQSNGQAAIRLTAGGAVSAQDILATSDHGQQTGNFGNSTTIDGGSASVSVQGGGDIGLHGNVQATGFKSATVTVAANGAGAHLASDAGKNVGASTTAGFYESSPWYTYNQPEYLASTTLQADAGIDLGGNASATLAGRNGDAYVGITTTGGKDAAIVQAAGTTILADGQRATINIAAGAQSPNGENGAAIDLAGRIQAQASSNAAMVTVSAAGGTLHDFAANSGSNAASVTVNAVDSAGKLVIDGSGDIGGNTSNGAGAALNVYGSGAVDAAASAIWVNNGSAANGAGARATLNATHGDLQLGQLAVGGNTSAVVGASASGKLTTGGRISANASGNNGYAGISLDASGDINVASGGAIAASGFGDNANANLSLNGATGIELGSDLGANAYGSGNARITATSGANARIDQHADVRINASGNSADVGISTGAFDLAGSLEAYANNGAANLNVNGSSGTVGGFAVTSNASQANASFSAADGSLTLAGNGSADGSFGAVINANAKGNLEVRGQLDATQFGVFGSAQQNMGSHDGTLLVGANGGLKAVAYGLQANASLNLSAAGGMTVDGDLAAGAQAGQGSVTMVTTGGTAATIVQGSDSRILAEGRRATVSVNAGSNQPDAASAAAFSLAGALLAQGSTDGAELSVTGAAGSIHHAAADSGSGAATVSIAAVGTNANLVLDGDIHAAGNNNNIGGSQLNVISNGAIDAGAASLGAVNLGGSAKVQLEAYGGDATLGNVTVSGTYATLDASTTGRLSANGALLATATGVAGQARVTLNGDSAATVAAGATVQAIANAAEGMASISLSSAAGVEIDGALAATANGNGGDAAIDLTANDGAIAVNAGLSALAGDSASIGILNTGGNVVLDADLEAAGGNAGVVSATVLDGSLVQQAGSGIHAGARNGLAQLALASSGAMYIDGDIVAAATADGSEGGMHTGHATVNLVTTGGASAAIVQAADSTIAAVGSVAGIRIAAGTANPHDNIGATAAFQLDGSLRAIDVMGGARIDIVGASGSVHDFTVGADGAPASASISALNGDLVLNGSGSVSGGHGGASLLAEASGAITAGGASFAVRSNGSDAGDYAEAGFQAYGGALQLGSTTVEAAAGAASLFATSSGVMTLPASLSASSATNMAAIDLSTVGGADAGIDQAPGGSILARGADANVNISAGSLKSGARALFNLGGDIQAQASTGAATIGIEGAGGKVHDFTARSTGNMASATITGTAADQMVMFDGAGSVNANANVFNGATLTVNSEGALDTRDANLSANNASIGDVASAKADLHANGGNATLGAIGVSGSRGAILAVTASGDLRADGALLAAATDVAGTASTELAAAGHALVSSTASVGAGAIAPSGSAYVGISADAGVTLEGDVQAEGANHASVNVLAAGGDVVLGGDLLSLSARNASVNVTALEGKIGQAAGATLRSGGSNSATVDFNAKGAMTVNGKVSAAATADGSVDGPHSGSAVVNLVTTGGASATIVQHAGSTIEAVGRAARLTVKAGDSNMGNDISATAAFDLGGTLRAVDAIGGSQLQIGGASGRVHDFTVSAADATAGATITAFNGDLVLDGHGLVTANASGSAGASLRAEASGSLDTTAATLDVHNASSAVNAGAEATLLANGGNAVLGQLNVSGANSAALAYASGDLDVTDRIAVYTTGNDGAASVVLDAGNTAHVDANGVLNTTGGNASLEIGAGNGLVLDGVVNTYGEQAGVKLHATTGELALNGAVYVQGSERGEIEASSGGTLVQSAGSSLHAAAVEGLAQVDLTSTGAMTIAGRVTAAATQDGSVHGVHSGSALVGLRTTGGAASSIHQAAGSTIEAVGKAARLAISAGDAAAQENAANSAAFLLDGNLRAIDDFGGSELRIEGAGGRVHDFTVAAAGATAKASILAVNGNLVLDGAGSVTADTGIDNSNNAGATLLVGASGSLETTAAVLGVSNASLEAQAGAGAGLFAQGGNAVLGTIDVNGSNAVLFAGASGNLDLTKTVTVGGTGMGTGTAQAALTAGGKAVVATGAALNATADAALGTAGIDVNAGLGVTLAGALNANANQANIGVTAASGNIALNGAVTALGGDHAGIDVQALDGALAQAAGTLLRSGATAGVAEVNLASSGALAINGNIVAAATADGSLDGAHTGAALVGITTTGGATAGINQAQASTITAVGRSAHLAINAGSANPAQDVAKAAAFKLDGTLRAIDEMGGSSLQIAGSGGSVHDFTVAAANASARAEIAAVRGDLVLTGTGSVTGNANEADGASLALTASGSLDTSGTTLSVANLSNGVEAGAKASLLATAGAAKLGVAKVTAQGGGTASFGASAGTTMVVNGKLDAANLGLGTAAGSALVKLNTTGKTDALSTLTQNSGATITAATQGKAGNATVDLQAGNCCNSAVELNDAVKAVVAGGSGNAALAVRGNTIAAKNLTANVTGTGTGNSMVSLAAPSTMTLAGTIDSQAASATARAGVQLVSDKLVDGATYKLSQGNGHVQLAPFSTGAIIGVHSDRDFDEAADVNYALVTLKKFMGQGAELSFGGEFDRSAWLDADGKVCLPGMEAWASQLQHTGAIHVAGNGRLNLGDVKMVFDTTGITTYHDPKLSAWSVPTGRVATLVVPPTNVDRYLDRTDNTLQNMNKVVQQTTAGKSSSGAAEAGQPVPRGTQIASKLFMDGNGVNMARSEAADGSQAGAQEPESERRSDGSATEQ